MLLTAAYYWRGNWRSLKLLSPPGQAELEEFVQSEAEPAGRVQPNG